MTGSQKSIGKPRMPSKGSELDWMLPPSTKVPARPTLLHLTSGTVTSRHHKRFLATSDFTATGRVKVLRGGELS